MKHNKTFHLHNGKTFSSLKGFANELKTMSHDIYKHHVSQHHNDFSNWIKNSLNKQELSHKVKSAKNTLETELIVLRELVHKESKKVTKKVPKKTVAKKKTVKKK